MDDVTPFEERLAARLRADAAHGAPRVSAAMMADEALRLAGRRSRFGLGLALDSPRRQWVLAGATAALIILGLLVALLVASRPPRSFPTDLIAYSDATTQSVWVMPRTGGPAQLVDGASWLGIDWSPDGRWLATTTDDLRIMLVRPDGTEGRVIGRGRDIKWSPDGRRIALIEPTTAGGQPVFHDLDSGHEARLPIPTGFSSAQLIGWLGDDAHVLIRACAGCGTQPEHRYAWFTLPGGDPVELPSDAQPGTLSPDGWTMAWSPCSSEGPVSECPGLYVSDLRTGATRQVGDPSAIAYDPMSWGPDGTWIVYPGGAVADFAEASGVWKARLDGSAPVELIHVPADVRVSPDGSQIAFVRIAEPDRSLALLSSDGSRTTELVHGANVNVAAWQPARPGAHSPEDPASDANAGACDMQRRVASRGCVVVQGEAAIAPLDVDPEVDPINVLDLNLEKRTGAPGLLTGIHDTSVVALAPGERCADATFGGSGRAPAGGNERWCVRTKAGTVVELSVIGYDADFGIFLAYERQS